MSLSRRLHPRHSGSSVGGHGRNSDCHGGHCRTYPVLLCLGMGIALLRVELMNSVLETRMLSISNG